MAATVLQREEQGEAHTEPASGMLVSSSPWQVPKLSSKDCAFYALARWGR